MRYNRTKNNFWFSDLEYIVPYSCAMKDCKSGAVGKVPVGKLGSKAWMCSEHYKEKQDADNQ